MTMRKPCRNEIVLLPGAILVVWPTLSPPELWQMWEAHTDPVAGDTNWVLHNRAEAQVSREEGVLAGLEHRILV